MQRITDWKARQSGGKITVTGKSHMRGYDENVVVRNIVEITHEDHKLVMKYREEPSWWRRMFGDQVGRIMSETVNTRRLVARTTTGQKFELI